MSSVKASGFADERMSLVTSGQTIAILHTTLSAVAFLSALVLGVAGHYERIVKNQWFGYPDEWWPSVSATIGDWYPERQIFQILVAITSGPRFAVVLGLYLLTRSATSSLPTFVACTGFARTIACGGWVYITSTDSADMHDIFMITYLVLNIPWMVGHTMLSPRSTAARRYRRLFASLFFASLVPLIYWYIQHKVHKRPGAYSIYSIFEWALIALDVSFDGIAMLDLGRLQVSVSQNDMVASTSNAAQLPVMMSTLRLLRFASECYMGLVFWTVMTALGPMIFYSSVWNMGLSGEEVLLFASLSPVLLGVPLFRRVLARHPSFLRALMLCGMAGHKIDDLGQKRLRLNAFAVGVGCLHYAAEWHGSGGDEEKILYKVSCFLVGLLGTVVLKFANFSLNPFWPFMNDDSGARMANGGYNTAGLVLGCAAWVVLALTRPSSRYTPIATYDDILARAAAILGFGSSLFLLQFLLTDSGTIIAWSWEGYPISGPTAMPHGVFTILAMSLAVFAAPKRRLLLHPAVFASACFGCWLLYAQKGWAGYGGGLVLGFYLVAHFPATIYAVTRCPPGSTFFFGFIVYAVLLLASVWTVAYAFVPGGPLLRERTDLVLAASMACIGAGFLNSRRSMTVQPMRATSSSPRPWTARLQLVLIFLLASTVLTVYQRRPRQSPRPYHADAKLVTAGIWTMHFALDGRMWESQRRMADIIRDAEIDVIGLLESDVHRIVGGNREMTQFIASSLNMYADIGPGPNKHTWGCALLSKFPILNSTHHLLPSPLGELAPAIHATLDVYGTAVDVVVSHNGQEEDPLDRELQSRELGRLMREAFPRPVIFLGYVVTKPHAPRPAPYRLLVEDGHVLDVDPADDDRWCEYILFRGLRRVSYARLNRGSNPSITDTELQVAKFVVPDEPQHSTSDRAETAVIRDETLAHRVDENLVTPAHRFPSMFYGNGVRGHYFHVLRDGGGRLAPMYYLSPEEEQVRRSDNLGSAPL